MSFKLGLVGLCTSHPENWVPAIRTLKAEGKVDAEVVAVWDSGETRPAGFSRDFAAKFNIPHSVENLEEMLELVDGVIVHTTNWDKHIEQARPFVEAGKAALLDKPHRRQPQGHRGVPRLDQARQAGLRRLQFTFLRRGRRVSKDARGGARRAALGVQLHRRGTTSTTASMATPCSPACSARG